VTQAGKKQSRVLVTVLPTKAQEDHESGTKEDELLATDSADSQPKRNIEENTNKKEGM